MQEKEINLVDLMFEVLLRWRVIVVVMVIGAVVLGSFGYSRSRQAYQEQSAKVASLEQRLQELREQKAQAEAAGEVTDEEYPEKKWLEEQLTEAQMVNVNNVITAEQYYQTRLAYSKETLILKMDPMAVPRAELTFLITSNNLENTYNIQKVYEDLLTSGEMLKTLANSQKKLTAEQVNELIYLEKTSYSLQQGSNIIRMAVLHTDIDSCKALAQAVVDFLTEQHHRMAEELGNHEISLLNQSLTTVFSMDILSQQQTITNDIAAREASIRGSKDAFSQIEWQYYNYLTTGVAKGNPDMVKEQEEEISPEVLEEENTITTELTSMGSVAKPGISVKYIILGMILAAFLYVAVIFVRFIMNNRLRDTDDIQAIYQLPLLGQVTTGEEKKKFLGFVDKWLLSLRDRNKRQFTSQEEIRLAAVGVKISAKKNALEQVYLIGCGLAEEAFKVCEQLKEILGKEGLEVQILNNVLYDAESMEELARAKGVVLVETAGKTLYAEVLRELELLDRQGIKRLGGIIVR